MGEKRIPSLIILLKKPGKTTSASSKTQKLEIFPASLFKTKLSYSWSSVRYRLRVNGKWFPSGKGYKFFTKYEIRDMMWRGFSQHGYL